MEMDGTYGGIISSLFPLVLRRHRANVFIETGTGWANGLLVALAVGFYKEIYSIESSFLYYKFACDFFQGNDTIHLNQGDSREVFPKVLNGVSERAVIWLDAHTFNEKNPLYDELDIIAKHPVKNHAILIDDRRMWGKEHDCWKDITEKAITEKILAINPDYKITYEDSINGGKDIFIADV